MYFQLQMIELYKNPSGEIQLSTLPKSEPPSNHPSQPAGSSEDDAKIAQLRETIRSLQTEIDAVSMDSQASLELNGIQWIEICWNVHKPLQYMYTLFPKPLILAAKRIGIEANFYSVIF